MLCILALLSSLHLIEAGNHWRWLPFWLGLAAKHSCFIEVVWLISRHWRLPPQAWTPLLPRVLKALFLRLIAALTSRTWFVPHSEHVQLLSLSFRLCFTYPHLEHVFEEANHLSALMTTELNLGAFFSNIKTKFLHPVSFIFFAFLRNFAIPFKSKSSRPMTWYCLTSSRASFSWKSFL